MHRLAVLVSGGGSNLQAIIDAINHHQIKNTQIACIISSNPNAFAIQRAKDNNISCFVVSRKTSTNPSNEILKIINEHQIDLVVLAGYLGILQGEILNKYKNKIINIHPALLPKYGGKGMYGHYVHEAVINNKEKESGATVHYVSNEIDGGKIIAQRKVNVEQNDTPDSLAKKILVQEHLLLVEVINKLLS